MPYWRLSHRAETVTRLIADRHYSRQKVGTPQFVPPGRCLVLKAIEGPAYWVTSWPFPEYVKHAWPGAWVCSAFRNEGAGLSSDMIREAVAITRWEFGAAPPLGMLTFVDPGKVTAKELPGYCFRRAGFKTAKCPKHRAKDEICPACHGRTKAGLVALQLGAAKVRDSLAPVNATGKLFARSPVESPCYSTPSPSP